MSDLQEIIHRTTHLAFESGELAERQRIVTILRAAKEASANQPSVPAYIVLNSIMKQVIDNNND